MNELAHFYLGTHMVGWLGQANVPLFVSRRRLEKQQRWPRARERWALDSGGFTELRDHGEWRIRASTYVRRIRRWQTMIGKLDWVAPMDWMCEPLIRAKTGLTVRQHQERTLDNFLELRAELGSLVIPVVQGWTLADYMTHVEMYDAAGVDLREESVVGVGSVCRRNQLDEICAILDELQLAGLSLHAFGVKGSAFAYVKTFTTSADSMAWSYMARSLFINNEPNPMSCRRHRRKSCANCLDFALWWRERMLSEPARSYQRRINGGTAPCAVA